MIEVELSVYMKGNYGCEITKKYPALVLEIVSGYTKKGNVQGLLKSNWSCDALKTIQKEIESFAQVEEVEILESGYAKIVINSSEFPLARLIHEAGAFYVYPIKFCEGREVCTIVFENKEKLQAVLKNLDDWRIVRIGNVNIQFDLEDLTPQQLRAVNLAIEKGYFEIPKKVNLKELSTQMKISRTTFLEHLRKAEKKILSKYFDVKD
jgi:predicted DNA binding protein